MRCSVFLNEALLLDAAIGHFVQTMTQAVKLRGVAFVALSGGNTPLRLYSRILEKREFYKAAIPWEKIHFFWSDERFVSHESSDSNFGNAWRGLLSHMPVRIENIHPIGTDGLLPDMSARRYQQTIERLVPIFDYLLLGIGSDGHTASLFGDPARLVQEKRWVVPVYQPGVVSPWRVSMTPILINSARNIVVLASGPEKAKPLLYALLGVKVPLIYPCQLIGRGSADVWWLTILKTKKGQ